MAAAMVQRTNEGRKEGRKDDDLAFSSSVYYNRQGYDF
jgi:hypothetical protein